MHNEHIQETPVFLGPGVIIEENVDLGPFCAILSSIDPAKQTTIKSGAIIGANATVNGGCQVGRNSFLKPGAFVERDVPENAIVSGNPGVVVGYREAARYSSSEDIGPIAGLGEEIGARLALNVGDSFVERLPYYVDMRGSLTPLESGRGLPFKPARVFLVYDVPSSDLRGEHAHLKCEQFLLAVHGSVSVVVEDGVKRGEVRLTDPRIGLYLPPMVWGTQYKFERDAILMVVASHPYEASDYIRDYDEFLRLVRAST